MKNLFKEVYMFLSSSSMILLVQLSSLLITNTIDINIIVILGVALMALMFTGFVVIKKETELFYEKMFNLSRLFAVLSVIPLLFTEHDNFITIFISSEATLLLIYISLYFYNKFTMIENNRNLKNS